MEPATTNLTIRIDSRVKKEADALFSDLGMNRRTSRLKKECRTMVKRGAKMEIMHDIIDLLRQGKTLPEHCKDHALMAGGAQGVVGVSGS